MLQRNTVAAARRLVRDALDGAVDPGAFAHLPGVLECIRVTRPFKLTSREVHPEDTVVEVGMLGFVFVAAYLGLAGPVATVSTACSSTRKPFLRARYLSSI